MGAPIFQLDKAKTALLIIDMQNDFLKVGAPLEVPTGRDIIPKH
jgi:ureidoacrylate peracid hydrolase